MVINTYLRELLAAAEQLESEHTVKLGVKNINITFINCLI